MSPWGESVPSTPSWTTASCNKFSISLISVEVSGFTLGVLSTDESDLLCNWMASLSNWLNKSGVLASDRAEAVTGEITSSEIPTTSSTSSSSSSSSDGLYSSLEMSNLCGCLGWNWRLTIDAP